MKDKIKYWLLGLLTLISVFLRFYDLTNLPKALAADEAALGYNAWSLLTTGKDEWGKAWPSK